MHRLIDKLRGRKCTQDVAEGVSLGKESGPLMSLAVSRSALGFLCERYRR